MERKSKPYFCLQGTQPVRHPPTQLQTLETPPTTLETPPNLCAAFGNAFYRF